MRLGICSWAFDGFLRGRRSVEELAAAASEAGFSSLEGSYAPRGPFGPQGEPASDPAVPVTSLATLELHRFHLTDPRPRHRERAFDVVDAMLRLAARWGLASVSFSPGVLAAEISREQTLDELAAGLRPRLERAGELGIRLALENLPGHLLERRATFLALLDRLPAAGVCLDLGNALLDPPVSAWVEELGPRLVKLHLTDGRTRDGRFEPTVPGAGEVPWPEVRERLATGGELPVFVEAMATDGNERERLAALHAAAAPLLGPAE